MQTSMVHVRIEGRIKAQASKTLAAMGFPSPTIEPDWLLIYQTDGDDIYLARTGTHSDLFD